MAMPQKIADDIRQMEAACRLAAEVLVHTGKFVKAGITTDELDQIADDMTRSRGARSACVGYHGYPKAICSSINDTICHGLPKKSDRLKDGDIVNIDVTVLLNGFHGDTSAMFFVGNVSEDAKKLCQVAFDAMHVGIKAARAGAFTGDIGFAIQKLVTRAGFYPVREVGGHGIGRGFHEDPFVPSFGKKGKGSLLYKWQTITVEPMVNETSAEIREVKIPGSKVTEIMTGDGALSAQYEHTILITDSDPQILTQC